MVQQMPLDNASSTEQQGDMQAIETLAGNAITADTNPVEAEVDSYFADTPILATIAGCESSYTQFNAGGTIYRGKVNHGDIGVMQINEYYHLKEAKALGYDIFSLKGNMAYAKYLYEQQGVAPWSASGACWQNSVALSSAGSDLALVVK